MNWKRLGCIFKEYASEFIGTAFLILCVVLFSDLALGASSPFVKHVSSQPIRLFGVVNRRVKLSH